MERQTDIAQTIELAADRARYDECAKKLLTYKAVIAWILKSCTSSIFMLPQASIFSKFPSKKHFDKSSYAEQIFYATVVSSFIPGSLTTCRTSPFETTFLRIAI